MEVFVKSFLTYRTVKHATVISSSIVVDSLDRETSTIVVKGKQISRSDAGSWLIVGHQVFLISGVTPGVGVTTLSLYPALEAFSRPIPFSAQSSGQTIGGFVSGQMLTHWRDAADPVYAIPYLSVSNLDTSPFSMPELDDAGYFILSDYCRLMRKSYGTTVEFFDAGSHLGCRCVSIAAETHQISFDDSRSVLQTAAFAESGVAKLTILLSMKTGEKDSNGDAIIEISESAWYLSDAGVVSQEIPGRRAAGRWEILRINGDANTDLRAAAVEAFAKSRDGVKLEFVSKLDLRVRDRIRAIVQGEMVETYISYRCEKSGDNRFYYKAGDLAVTASEKLKGVIK